MAAGHWILCAIACFAAVGFGRSTSSMTLAEKPWPSKAMWACRRNGSSGFWTGSWPGVGIRVSCVWTMVQNLSLRRWLTGRQNIPSNWNLSSRGSPRRIPISNDSTAPIAMRCSICMSLIPCRKCGPSRKNGWINTTRSAHMMRSGISRPSNIDGPIKRRKTLT